MRDQEAIEHIHLRKGLIKKCPSCALSIPFFPESKYHILRKLKLVHITRGHNNLIGAWMQLTVFIQCQQLYLDINKIHNIPVILLHLQLINSIDVSRWETADNESVYCKISQFL